MKLRDKIINAGIEKCMFLVPMTPLHSVFGFISYKSSSDQEVLVPATISESRYKVSENYKITLQSIYGAYGKENYYLSDLEIMIEKGTVKMFIQA